MLEAELRAVLPDLGEISNPRRLTGGASRETWAFENGDRPLIYRRGAGVGREAGAIRAAAHVGVPEPEVLAFGEDWAVMERVEGETIARRILRDERFAAVRPKLAEQCGEILARIHTIPADAVPGLESHDVLADLEGDDPRVRGPLPGTRARSSLAVPVPAPGRPRGACSTATSATAT